MAFFNKLNDLAKTFGEKTNDVIETGKLTAKVSSQRSAAGEELKKIGEYYYNLYAAGEPVAQEVLEFCQAAREHFAAAAEAQAEIDRLQAEKDAARAEAEAREAEAREAALRAAEIQCPNCAARNAPGMRFCSSCGTRLETASFCPECGAKNEAGTRFCGNCGQKLL